MSIPKGHTAVMANRVEPPDSLDFFPTPPWATRAFCELMSPMSPNRSAWEPAAGQGHMADVLREHFSPVRASDVHDYGGLDAIGSFVGDGPDSVHRLGLSRADWIVTNPPFRLACEFAEKALDVAGEGVALLVRSVWAEGAERYERLFSKRPPMIVAQFVERVPMTKGRWDPNASTATSYAWFVWAAKPKTTETAFLWIPPGCRQRLTKPDDRKRFAAWSIEEKEAPLLEARG